MSAQQAATAAIPVKTRTKAAGISLILSYLITGGLVVGIAVTPDRGMVGLLTLIALVIIALTGIPMGLGMIVVGAVALYSLTGQNAVSVTMEHAGHGTVASWQLSVIPMFILMGLILGRSGLVSRSFTGARQWIGKVPGGLALSTNAAGAVLAAGSGSTMGIVYALGRVAIPDMLRAGYQPGLAVATVTGAGILGQIIPPSLMLVIYAGVVENPIGPQLLAGMVPGILLAVGIALMILIRVLIKPSLAPRGDVSDISWAGRWRGIIDILPVLLVVAIVIGGLYLGVFTATEAGVFGALIAALVGIVNMRRDKAAWREIGKMLWESVTHALIGSAAIFILLMGVYVVSKVLAITHLAQDLATAVTGLGLDRIGLLFVLMALYFVLAMFMDELAMILLTVPVLLPVLNALDVDLIFFGVFIVLMAEIGLLTPPMGMLNFIMHRIVSDPEVNGGKRISLVQIFLGSWWFVAVALLLVIALIFLPEIATWLPNLSGS